MTVASLSDANAYFAGTLKEVAWADHSEIERAAAIKDAGRILQALGLRNPTQPNLDYATYEQAYCLLEMPEDTAARLSAIATGLKGTTVSKQSETYQDADKLAALVGGVYICPSARAWIAEFLRPDGTVVAGALRWRGDRRRRG